MEIPFLPRRTTRRLHSLLKEKRPGRSSIPLGQTNMMHAPTEVGRDFGPEITRISRARAVRKATTFATSASISSPERASVEAFAEYLRGLRPDACFVERMSSLPPPMIARQHSWNRQNHCRCISGHLGGCPPLPGRQSLGYIARSDAEVQYIRHFGQSAVSHLPDRQYTV